MENKVQMLNKDICNTWQTILKSKGYLEWINADVSCYLVAVQMKLVAQEIADILKQTFTIHKNQEDNLDVVFVKMTILCNDLLNFKDAQNINFSVLIEHQKTLYNLITRVLYFVQ